jgi:hypothetical protein
MRPRILEIFRQLSEFGNDSNEVHAENLFHIAETTTDDTERDQAVDLMLFCEANENGSLGMDSLKTIAQRYDSKGGDV